jgi:hypothetical protein
VSSLTYQRPKLYAKQTQAFFNDSRYAWIEDSTKSGKTFSCRSWLFKQALFHGKAGGNSGGWLLSSVRRK